jgi:hypothetical protein
MIRQTFQNILSPGNDDRMRFIPFARKKGNSRKIEYGQYICVIQLIEQADA